MTTTVTPPVDAVVPEEETRPSADPPSSAGRKDLIRRLAIGVVAAGLFLFLFAGFFTGPVGSAWYQSRQHHLSSDFTAEHGAARKGQAVAVLQIPRISLNVIVGQGDGPAELRAGPGHRPGSPQPGEKGNSLIFGHRKGWGHPFAKLDQLQPKDQIYLQTRSGQTTLFLVTSVQRVGEGARQSLVASDDTRITLITGSGGTSSGGRLVVTAVSGQPGKLQDAGKVHPGLPDEPFVNQTLLLFVLLANLLAGAVLLLRRRYHVVTLAVVVAPIAFATLLAFFLEVDLLLPALR